MDNQLEALEMMEVAHLREIQLHQTVKGKTAPLVSSIRIRRSKTVQIRRKRVVIQLRIAQPMRQQVQIVPNQIAQTQLPQMKQQQRRQVLKVNLLKSLKKILEQANLVHLHLKEEIRRRKRKKNLKQKNKLKKKQN